jgi:hypothetical protein
MLLPVFLLSGCGAFSCFNNTVQEGGAGTVTFVNPPTTVTPGTTGAGAPATSTPAARFRASSWNRWIAGNSSGVNP